MFVRPLGFTEISSSNTGTIVSWRSPQLLASRPALLVLNTKKTNEKPFKLAIQNSLQLRHESTTTVYLSAGFSQQRLRIVVPSPAAVAAAAFARSLTVGSRAPFPPYGARRGPSAS